MPFSHPPRTAGIHPLGRAAVLPPDCVHVVASRKSARKNATFAAAGETRRLRRVPLEHRGLRRARRTGLTRAEIKQPLQPGVLGLQLLHLILQGSQFSIQDTSLHAYHLPARRCVITGHSLALSAADDVISFSLIQS